jgi:hypothetical protein
VKAGAQSWSGIIATSRAADWTKAGAGLIPTNRTQCGSTIAAYTGSPSVIANAFNACPAGTYLQLGAGTFNITGTIFLSNSNVTLRGMGPRSTIINASSISPCGASHPAAICVAGGDDSFDGSNPPNISNVTGLSQGSTTISLGTQTTGTLKPVVGQIIELNQAVDGTSTAADTWPQVFSCVLTDCAQAAGGGGADGSPQAGPFQLVVVNSITAGTCTDSSTCTVGITPPIRMPNWGAQAVRVWWQNETAATGVGVEDLQINGPNPIIGFRWARNSWMRNVELNGSVASGAPHYVFLNHSALVTVRDSYIFGQGNGSDEYAVDCYGCGSTLFENNIMEYIRSGFLQEMAEGNVVSYNYQVGNASGLVGTEEGGFNNHGCCDGYHLEEGNDFITSEHDNYFGNEQFMTLFRNRLEGYTSLDILGSTGNTLAMYSGPLGRFANIVGNIMGSGQYAYYLWQGSQACGSPSLNNDNSVFGIGGICGGSPNDLHAFPSTMMWGNYDSVTAAVRWCGNSSDPGWSTICSSTSEVPVGLTNYANPVPSSTTLPASFLYSTHPSWWCVVGQTCAPWPAIGPDVTSGNLPNSGGHANKIPARQCFEQVMGGSFADTIPRGFDANVCYGTLTSGTPPTPPTALTASVK